MSGISWVVGSGRVCARRVGGRGSPRGGPGMLMHCSEAGVGTYGWMWGCDAKQRGRGVVGRVTVDVLCRLLYMKPLREEDAQAD